MGGYAHRVAQGVGGNKKKNFLFFFFFAIATRVVYLPQLRIAGAWEWGTRATIGVPLGLDGNSVILIERKTKRTLPFSKSTRVICFLWLGAVLGRSLFRNNEILPSTVDLPMKKSYYRGLFRKR